MIERMVSNDRKADFHDNTRVSAAQHPDTGRAPQVRRKRPAKFARTVFELLQFPGRSLPYAIYAVSAQENCLLPNSTMQGNAEPDVRAHLSDLGSSHLTNHLAEKCTNNLLKPCRNTREIIGSIQGTPFGLGGEEDILERPADNLTGSLEKALEAASPRLREAKDWVFHPDTFRGQMVPSAKVVLHIQRPRADFPFVEAELPELKWSMYQGQVGMHHTNTRSGTRGLRPGSSASTSERTPDVQASLERWPFDGLDTAPFFSPALVARSRRQAATFCAGGRDVSSRTTTGEHK